MDDLEFINNLKAGSESAFKSLVKLYQSQVINTCYRFLLNKEEAQDIAQEVFVEVFQSIQFFRGDSKLSTWIYRIAVTKSIDELKRQRRKKRFSSIAKILHLDEISNWLEGGSKSDETILNKERNRELHIALNKLPDNQRIAFTLGRIEGYNNQEIAEIMQTSTRSVESLVYRAKVKMRENLKQILSNSD